jgi:hypothetical protein
MTRKLITAGLAVAALAGLAGGAANPASGKSAPSCTRDGYTAVFQRGEMRLVRKGERYYGCWTKKGRRFFVYRAHRDGDGFSELRDVTGDGVRFLAIKGYGEGGVAYAESVHVWNVRTGKSVAYTRDHTDRTDGQDVKEWALLEDGSIVWVFEGVADLELRYAPAGTEAKADEQLLDTGDGISRLAAADDTAYWTKDGVAKSQVVIAATP